MPTFRVTAPDGTKFKVTAPEGATEAEVMAYAQSQFSSKQPSVVIPGTPPQPEPQETSWIDTLKGLDTGLMKMAKGAVAAPIGVFGGIAKNILEGGYGTKEGAQRGEEFASNFIKNAVGEVSPNEQEALAPIGRATQGLTPLMGLPSEMAAMAKLGGPALAQLNQSNKEAAGITFRPMAESLMRSALKPTVAANRTGDAQVAVDTLLKYGINPTKGGVEKLQAMLAETNADIASRIANSRANVSRETVSSYLEPVRAKFGNQVNPAQDLNAIQNAADEFARRPSMIPIQKAQDLKQGTYQVLAGKYGETGSAATEAQKALARGLKEEIANAVPEVGLLNAKDSALYKTLEVAERRALMDMNKNPMGLSLLTHNPIAWAGFMADKSALFKSITARMLNAIGEKPPIPPMSVTETPMTPEMAGLFRGQ